MCYYQLTLFECPACSNVVGRSGEDRECKHYIQTRDREMARMHKWKEGSRERAPPTPFVFGWCEYGNTERDPVTVVSEKACEACLGPPSDNGATTSFVHGMSLLSSNVQALPSPLASVEDELDKDKLELDFPMFDALDSKGPPTRRSKRVRVREESKAEAAAAQNRAGTETRGRPTSSRRK